MASDWIQFSKDLPKKPEVFFIASMTGLTCDDVVGKLMRFWSWVDDNTDNGIISLRVDGPPSTVASRMVDAVVSFDGFCAVLQKVGWINIGEGGHIVVPKHDRHMSNSAKARMLKTERQRRYRERKIKSEIVDAVVDASPSTRPSPEKRREEKSIKTPLTPQCPHEEMKTHWNDLCQESGLQACRTAWPSKEAKARWADQWFREDWRAIMQTAHRNDWCRENRIGVLHVLRPKNAARYRDEHLSRKDSPVRTHPVSIIIERDGEQRGKSFATHEELRAFIEKNDLVLDEARNTYRRRT